MKEKEIERLFHQYYAQMTRLAITMLYDDEEARDVVSEVFATFVKLECRGLSDDECTKPVYESVATQKCQSKIRTGIRFGSNSVYRRNGGH